MSDLARLHANVLFGLGALGVAIGTAGPSAAQISPVFSQTVAANGTRDNPGASANSGLPGAPGPLTFSDFAVRAAGAANASLVTFHQYDLSSVPTSIINDPGFDARFAIDYTESLFDTTTSVSFGTVGPGNTWDASGDAGTVPLHGWADPEVIVDPSVLISSVQTFELLNIVTATSDITGTVRDWANGVQENNGLAVFVSGVNDSIGYSAPRILASLEQTSPLQESISVSLDGDEDSPGQVDSGTKLDNESFNNAEFFVRDRAPTQAEDIKQIATFHRFDVSGLTAEQVNSEVFSARFSVDFVEGLNDVVNSPLQVRRVLAENTWDTSGQPGTVPLYEWSDDITDTFTLTGNVREGVQPPATLIVDVTGVVQDWVNGVQPNNGLVLSIGPNNQGAAYNNPQLTTLLPISSIIENDALGDFNGDLVVDGADYALWRNSLGQDKATAFAAGSFVGTGVVGASDLDTWKDNFGTVFAAGAATAPAVAAPSPASLGLLCVAVVAAGPRARQRRRI